MALIGASWPAGALLQERCTALVAGRVHAGCTQGGHVGPGQYIGARTQYIGAGTLIYQSNYTVFSLLGLSLVKWPYFMENS